ncbi:MAG TPA: 4-hydroxythreonine-4-phosphate dehydrogenase PdxA [Candidatus Omnitrophota bacterium]|nr:4-hydroxythreonine-4-phosphate dehydrogenase PdxA [Candidatus Omnitrophota bacterium]
MSKSAVRVIGITMGDPSGIGPEVIRKALKKGRFPSCAAFVIIGSQKLFKNIPVPVIDIAYRTPGQGALKSLERAVALVKGGVVDALVTAPLSKEAVSRYQKDFRGHTEYLARAFGVKRFDMMFVSPRVRISLVTRHVPLKNVPALITKKAVLDSIALMDETLKRHFHIRSPRIAVLGLNPHAGEGGLLGHEDLRAILPAIRSARQQGIKAQGPFPADTFFVAKLSPHGSFDGIVAMYHDQGLTPVKGLYFKELVNFTAGLPFVRTSPVHGTALDIAGHGIADPSSMIAAIQLACELALSKAAGGGRVEGLS